VFEANSDAEFQTPAGDHIDYSNVLGKAYWIVKRHDEHARRDADPFRAGGDCSGYRQNRGEVAVFDEMVLREPTVVESVRACRSMRSDRGLRRRVGPGAGATSMGFGSRTKDRSVFFDYPDSWLTSPDYLPFVGGRWMGHLKKVSV